MSEQSKARLRGYETLPGDIEEHAAIEQSIVDGGYGHRQLFELIQNAADAIRDAGKRGRIEVRLSGRHLYCANEGSPLHREGANAILHSHVSAKRSHEIGHFGVGFKSVLGISSHVGVYSRPGSFEFDTGLARQRILTAVPAYSGRTPGLRLATPVDPVAASAEDPRLQDLMAWATTVIRLSRDRARAADLAKDLAGFPAEFLLFSPHVAELRLYADESGVDRLIRVASGENGEWLLQDGDEDVARWRVFKRVREMSALAKDDAGEATARDQVEVAWAVPLGRRRTAGQYWAFFPTTYESSLTGILNAPWKTNSDRQGLLEGLYNREIIDVGAHLVADSLAALYDESDPGSHLDLLPARLEDAEGWANQELTATVYKHTAEQPILPDASSQLRQPRLLKLLPRGASDAALDVWNKLPSKPGGWAHSRAGTRERRPRALRLGAADGPTDGWLEAIAAPAIPQASVAAIRAAARCETESRQYGRTQIPGQLAAIVLTADGTLVRPLSAAVFFRGAGHAPVTSVALVHSEVEADPEAQGILAERFGIRLVAPLIELEVLLREARQPGFGAWEALWSSVRRLQLADASRLLWENRPAFRVRTVASTWVRPWEALFPGSIVPNDGSRDRAVAVDTTFHHDDQGALELLGVVESPTPSGLGNPEFHDRVWWPKANWQARYQDECLTEYQSQGLRTFGSRPQGGSISVSFGELAGPISPFFTLSEVGKDAFVRALLPLAASDDAVVWYHETRRNVYPDLEAESPSQWLIREHATLPTSLGGRPLRDAVGPELERWNALLPVVAAECSFLGLPEELANLPEKLVSAAYQAALSTEDLNVVMSFYGEMGLAGWPAPDRVRVMGPAGPVSQFPADVVVTHEIEVAQLLAVEQAVLLAETPEQSEALAARWGMKPTDADATVRYEAVGPGPPVPLADAFPGLPPSIISKQGDVDLVPCETIWRERSLRGGVVRTEVAFQLLEPTQEFLYQAAMDAEEVLTALMAALSIELTVDDVKHAVRRALDEHQERRVAQVRDLPSTDQKLAALLGVDGLQRMLPSELLGDAAPRQDAARPEALAAMVLAIHGSAVLQMSRLALEAGGFAPPPARGPGAMPPCASCGRWASPTSTLALHADRGRRSSKSMGP
ncbi:MAG: ATP-binding protein [Dehalococcoidia bacterium]